MPTYAEIAEPLLYSLLDARDEVLAIQDAVARVAAIRDLAEGLLAVRALKGPASPGENQVLAAIDARDRGPGR
jgi:hypothetical protein